MLKKYSANLVVLLLITQLAACSSIDYFSHLAKGQFDLLWQREPVAEVLADDEIPDVLRERLVLSQALREFAATALSLPVGDAYTSYTDLQRDYVVWNVYAAPELSMQSYTWCYPLLGCMAYRGYFEEARAKVAAKELEAEGYEVKVGGVQAYSTLGYFDDPLLNTFLFNKEPAFIELLIHELAHRKLYIKDDTAFNENFASAVGYLGARQWYAASGREDEFQAFTEYKEQFKILIDFLLAYKERLLQVYTNDSFTNDQKRHHKEQTMAALQADYLSLKQEMGWDTRYDRWVATMNNASFATLSNYQQWVPVFVRLFEQQGGDWQRFYEAVEQIADLEKPEREKHLTIFLEAERVN